MRATLLLLFLLPVAGLAAVPDRTAQALQRCLNDPIRASTADQTDCEAKARHDYDQRMNLAYNRLLQKLPAAAATRLKTAQRAWLGFRDLENAARSALYQTREGTMYVPMEAADATNLTRDRALQLEAYLRVLRIDQ
jgi:uncharacterized protein YecT (DUF1311 family)